MNEADQAELAKQHVRQIQAMIEPVLRGRIGDTIDPGLYERLKQQIMGLIQADDNYVDEVYVRAYTWEELYPNAKLRRKRRWQYFWRKLFRAHIGFSTPDQHVLVKIISMPKMIIRGASGEIRVKLQVG